MRKNYLPFFGLLCLWASNLHSQAVTMAYYSPGSYTFVVPAGYVANITVQAWGGGGGGGGGNNNDNSRPGGGGGAFTTNTYTNVPAGSYSIVVGVGGGPGVDGGSSSYTFTGGTVTAGGGGGADNNSIGVGGTFSGPAGGGSNAGGNGGDRSGNNQAGGGGGGSGIAAGAGGHASGNSGGAGGAPGGGVGGATGAPGQNGSAPGGGGGGRGDAGGTSGSGGSGWVIVIVGSSPLPVELSAFNASLRGESVELLWETATELNNEKFIVESSTEGEVFFSIGEIQGAGTVTEAQKYRFVHHTPSAGINYYRLKQLDLDGTFAYTKVLAVNAPGVKDMRAFPNPVQDKLYLQYELSRGPGNMLLLDGLGRRVNAQVMGSTGAYEINLPLDLPRGMYWLRVERAGKVQTLPVVKE